MDHNVDKARKFALNLLAEVNDHTTGQLCQAVMHARDKDIISPNKVWAQSRNVVKRIFDGNWAKAYIPDSHVEAVLQWKCSLITELRIHKCNEPESIVLQAEGGDIYLLLTWKKGTQPGIILRNLGYATI